MLVERNEVGGYRVWSNGCEFTDLARAEQVHSLLGEAGARKVFALGGNGIEGTYLLPPVVETHLAIEG
jgi:hypothetical protein